MLFRDNLYSVEKLKAAALSGPVIDIDPDMVNREYQFETVDEEAPKLKYTAVIEYYGRYVVVIGNKDGQFRKAYLISKPRLKQAKLDESVTEDLVDAIKAKESKPTVKSKEEDIPTSVDPIEDDKSSSIEVVDGKYSKMTDEELDAEIKRLMDVKQVPLEYERKWTSPETDEYLANKATTDTQDDDVDLDDDLPWKDAESESDSVTDDSEVGLNNESDMYEPIVLNREESEALLDAIEKAKTEPETELSKMVKQRAAEMDPEKRALTKQVMVGIIERRSNHWKSGTKESSVTDVDSVLFKRQQAEALAKLQDELEELEAFEANRQIIEEVEQMAPTVKPQDPVRHQELKDLVYQNTPEETSTEPTVEVPHVGVTKHWRNR